MFEKNKLIHIECFHVTSQRPYWCPKTMKWRPYWCPKRILWDLSSILIQKCPIVFALQNDRRSRE